MPQLRPSDAARIDLRGLWLRIKIQRELGAHRAICTLRPLHRVLRDVLTFDERSRSSPNTDFYQVESLTACNKAHQKFIMVAMSQVILDAGDMRRTLGRMAHEILEANQGAEDLVVVGVLRRGYPIAKRLAFLMTQIEGNTVPCGKLDIRPFRDDHPSDQEDESEIPFEVTGRRVVIVDEVIFTGRTIRAAIDGLFRHGRPKSVQLAVLIDRGHRELPIMPNYTGKVVQTAFDDHVVVKVNEIDDEDAVVLEGKAVPA